MVPLVGIEKGGHAISVKLPSLGGHNDPMRRCSPDIIGPSVLTNTEQVVSSWSVAARTSSSPKTTSLHPVVNISSSRDTSDPRPISELSTGLDLQSMQRVLS